MPDTEITKSVNVVVDKVDTNTYGDLLFTDKEGNKYKISQKRAHFFEGIIVPDVAVKLNYAVYMKKEYIYNAIQIKDQLPPPVAPKVTPAQQKIVDEAVAEVKPSNIDEREMRIIREVAAKCVSWLVAAGKVELGDIARWFRSFEKYIIEGTKK